MRGGERIERGEKISDFLVHVQDMHNRWDAEMNPDTSPCVWIPHPTDWKEQVTEPLPASLQDIEL